MIYGVLEDQAECHTRMQNVFKALNHAQKNYNWLIAYPEIWTRQHHRLSEQKDYFFMTGEELTKIVEEDDSQWIWGVLSGFDKDIPLSEILRYPLVDANGYEGFWKNPLTFCNPLSKLEIVAWDSTLTLVLSSDKKIVDDFKKAYPKAENLCEYNQSMFGGKKDGV